MTFSHAVAVLDQTLLRLRAIIQAGGTSSLSSEKRRFLEVFLIAAFQFYEANKCKMGVDERDQIEDRLDAVAELYSEADRQLN